MSDNLIGRIRRELKANPPAVLSANQRRTEGEMRNKTGLLKQNQHTLQQKYDAIGSKLKEKDLQNRVVGLENEIGRKQEKSDTAKLSGQLYDRMAVLSKGIDDNRMSADAAHGNLTAHIGEANVIAEALREKDWRMGKAMIGNMHLHSDEQVHTESVAALPTYVEVNFELRIEDTDSVEFTADNTTNKILKTAHGLSNWDKIAGLKNSGGALPAGLSDQVYWVMNATANDFQLTTDKPGTASPSAATFTDDGTGTHRYLAVTDTRRHNWLNGPAKITIADTIVDFDLDIDDFDPSAGSVRNAIDETLPPMFYEGVCPLRVYLAGGTILATEDFTVTCKVQSDVDSKLMGMAVADLTSVTTFTS